MRHPFFQDFPEQLFRLSDNVSVRHLKISRIKTSLQYRIYEFLRSFESFCGVNGRPQPVFFQKKISGQGYGLTEPGLFSTRNQIRGNPSTMSRVGGFESGRRSSHFFRASFFRAGPVFFGPKFEARLDLSDRAGFGHQPY